MDLQLIQVRENETVTTSLLVAEKFGKNHSHVLRDINNLISKIEENPILDTPRFFEKSQYITTQNKKATMYYMNRDGFTLLAMGFTGKEALEWKLKYIQAFNEMENRIKSYNTILDNRLELSYLLAKATKQGVNAIMKLYPEYFSTKSASGSLEYISDVNTSYTKWKDDYNIDKEWIGEFPTIDIYNHYMRYCVENRLNSMGKKTFYSTLENDFNLTKYQKTDGYRYFMSA